MAEPFSTAAAGIALIANLKNLYDYLKEVKDGIDNIHEDIDALQKEIGTLKELCESVVDLLRDGQDKRSLLDAEQEKRWNGLSKPLQTMEVAIQEFDEKLRKVFGNNPKRRAYKESVKKWRRFKEVESALSTLRSTISNNREKIVVWMHSIGISKMDSAYKDIMAKLTNLEKANDAARALPQTVNKNKHFAIPKAVESHYLGRETELNTLAQAFWPKDQVKPHRQKRYVISGVGGSGKTQFCGKYAQEFRDSYWGVFWVDGASEDRLKESLVSNVAEKGGVGKHYKAALDWLSGLHEDWLLIIDNADDTDLDLSGFFPSGANGHVLITTRDQDCALGNLGSMPFHGMQESDANELFLKVSNIKESAENRQHVRDILSELGYLALAIVVAGSAIHQGYCKLKSYLKYLDKVWRGRRLRREASGLNWSPEKEREGRVEAQFDLSLDAIKKREMQAIKKGDEHDRTAARDAPELLRTFAFMHREKVRYEFLKLCAENPKKERTMESAETEVSSATQSWGQYFLEKLLWFSNAPNRHPSSTVLPDVLRQARNTGRLDGIRVRRAMKYLRSYSLVTHDEETDSWSMHPLIQRWAREGYESNPGEHHVWFHAAATLVSSCIVLTDTNNGNEELMRQLLPHVSTVRERQKALKNRVTENQYGRNKWYPVLDWGVKTHLLLMYAKFSMVYVSVGMFHEASELQRVVHRALESLRGYENSKTRRMSIFWARSLWALGRADEAAKLTEKLMDNCQRIFGPDHQETHVASIKLAHARLAQGRVIEARALCDRSVPELEKQCGPEDDKTLDALDIYAMAILLTGRPGAVERAKSLNRRTWKTRERLLGAEHVDTLASRQSFHATSFWDGNQVKHREAEEGMEEVARLFSKRLGREHPFTLLSMLYLARVKVELQDFDGAQQLFDQGLPIAERNLAEDHIAVLFCRYHIGRMRVRQGRWREARDELVDVSARQSIALQGWGRFHHDRIGTLIELARAHHELGEYDECDAVVEEAFEGFARNTGPVHPWAERLRADWEGWKRQRNPQLLTASSIERAVT